MDKKSRNTLIISVIALALVLIVVTYAYFSARITGLESASTISLTAGRMAIHYSEGNEEVSFSNIYPRSEAWITKQITLTGYNNTNIPLYYDLGIIVDSNTFKGGELTFSLTGEGANGNKIPNINNKSIIKTEGFYKIGTGFFSNSDGDTHVYTISFYFKDLYRNQNINQDAVFNGKFSVIGVDSTYLKAIPNISSQNNNNYYCFTDNYVVGATPLDGAEYVNGQYTYKYNYQNAYTSWVYDSTMNGWGVVLTDKSSTDSITSDICTYIDDLPIVSYRSMFQLSKATSVDLSSFNTQNVTTMRDMFAGSAFQSLNVSYFDTSNVTSFASMFRDSELSTLIGLDSFDTSNAESLSYMFRDNDLSSINVRNFNTSKVLSLKALFSNSLISSIDLSSFDTSNVGDVSEMFYNMPNITSLDLSSFDTSKVIYFNNMFNGSNNLTTIFASDKFVVRNDATSDNMFYNLPKIKGGLNTGYDENYVDKVRAHIDGGQSNPGYFTAK